MKLNYLLILIICVLLLCFNLYIFKQNSASDRMQDTIIRLAYEDSIKVFITIEQPKLIRNIRV